MILKPLDIVTHCFVSTHHHYSYTDLQSSCPEFPDNSFDITDTWANQRLLQYGSMDQAAESRLRYYASQSFYYAYTYIYYALISGYYLYYGYYDSCICARERFYIDQFYYLRAYTREIKSVITVITQIYQEVEPVIKPVIKRNNRNHSANLPASAKDKYDSVSHCSAV